MFRILAPPADLQPFVRFFWAARAPGAAASEHIIPDGCCELILHFGARPLRVIEGAEPVLQPRAFIFGQIERAIELDLHGDVDVFGVRFQPCGVAALWALDASALGPRECALEDLFSGSWRLHAERLHEAPHTTTLALSARYACIVDWLRATARSVRTPPVARAAAALSYLRRADVDASSAARAIGVSRRGLERAFRAAVGLSPGAYLRLRRVDDCARALRRENAALSAIALEAGYADQSHFCREFREVVGLSPGAYRRRLGLAPPALDD
jgi:AraC-like DNA-binding protein